MYKDLGKSDYRIAFLAPRRFPQVVMGVSKITLEINEYNASVDIM